MVVIAGWRQERGSSPKGKISAPRGVVRPIRARKAGNQPDLNERQELGADGTALKGRK